MAKQLENVDEVAKANAFKNKWGITPE